MRRVLRAGHAPESVWAEMMDGLPDPHPDQLADPAWRDGHLAAIAGLFADLCRACRREGRPLPDRRRCGLIAAGVRD